MKVKGAHIKLKSVVEKKVAYNRSQQSYKGAQSNSLFMWVIYQVERSQPDLDHGFVRNNYFTHTTISNPLIKCICICMQ